MNGSASASKEQMRWRQVNFQQKLTVTVQPAGNPKWSETNQRKACLKKIRDWLMKSRRITLWMRHSKSGKLPIKFQMAEELKRRQLKNKTAPKNRTHANFIEDDAPDITPPVPPRRSAQLALPIQQIQFSYFCLEWRSLWNVGSCNGSTKRMGTRESTGRAE